MSWLRLWLYRFTFNLFYCFFIVKVFPRIERFIRTKSNKNKYKINSDFIDKMKHLTCDIQTSNQTLYWYFTIGLPSQRCQVFHHITHFPTTHPLHTHTQVTSRPTICLINFVLSGKAVLLEQPRKTTTKIISHVLTSHSGTQKILRGGEANCNEKLCVHFDMCILS